MPDATLADFEALVGKVHMGEHPILPQPTWGQDAAYLAFLIDGLRTRHGQLVEAARRVVAMLSAQSNPVRDGGSQALVEACYALAQVLGENMTGSEPVGEDAVR